MSGMDQLPFSINTIETFVLMFVRIASIIALLPVFGSYAVPAPLKVGLSLILTALVFSPSLAAHPFRIEGHFSAAMLTALIIKEAFVGLAIGFASTFLFAAVNFAARLVDTEMGFGMVDLIDPFTEEAVSAIGQLWIIVFTLVLLFINGHYFFLLAVQKSFELIPIAGAHIQAGPLASQFSSMVATVFELALKMAAPVYVALVLTQMALGVVARTVPQINIFFVGLPLQIIVGLGATMVVFPILASMFRKIFENLIKDIWSLLFLMA